MRHISKQAPHLISDSHKSWEKSRYRKSVRSFLVAEQNELCGYCERQISYETSHSEHIKPKSIFPQDTFNYENLIASCDGYFKESIIATQETCGHGKGDEYDSQLFLDPTQVTDIQDYFMYDKEDGKIVANHNKNSADQSKANYMINLLNLNSEAEKTKNTNALPDARINKKNALIKTIISEGIAPQNYKEMVNKLLTINTPFISFLEYCFK